MLNKYREDFPILQTTVNGHPLAYLDNAATTQKPKEVIEAVDGYYRSSNANPHRGNYTLSVKATDIFEDSRKVVQEFIHAARPEEVIFTKNTTESLNLVAYCYGMSFINPGDEIVVSILEHHSNIIPWQRVAKARGATLKFMYLDPNGAIAEEEVERKITPKTKLVAFAHVSNVMGTVSPAERIIRKAHSVGAVTVLDCAQSIPHMPIDVQKFGADFVAFSGHKMMAPMGIGVLYGRRELLDKMPPFLAGGEMIDYVTEQDATWAELPQKFEGGTQNVGGALGLATAIHYIRRVGYDTIRRLESDVVNYACERLAEVPDVTVYGESTGVRRCGVVSFNVKDAHPHDVASILDASGVAIRAGHHCAQPLMKYLGINAACRASFYFYNTREEVDQFVASLRTVRRWLGFGA